MRAIVAPNQAAAAALGNRVDAAHGYPRCDRLSGTLVTVTVVSCPCVAAVAPKVACQFKTTADRLPVQTATAWAMPVNEGDATTMGALTAPERASVVDVTPADPPGIASIASVQT